MNTKYKKQFTRTLSFWGKSCMEGLGVSLAVGAVLLVLVAFGQGFYESTYNIPFLLSLSPYYVLFSGGFCVLTMTIGYFQVYFPVLLSMNATRKHITLGIFLFETGIIAALILLCALIWIVVPGDISQSGMKALPLLCGILLTGAAFGTILGAVITRWGKIGVLIFIVFMFVTGGIGGALAALLCFTNTEFLQRFSQITGNLALHFIWITLAVGIVLYAASGLISYLITKKAEARI